VNIRRATTEDVDALLDAWKRANAAPSVTDTPADVRRFLEQEQAIGLVAIDGAGTVEGSLFVTFDGWRGNFYRLTVTPAYRRQGVALALVAEGERWLQSVGARRLTALVEGDRTGSQSFWEAAGFEHYKGMRRYRKEI
jgi:ribosomal protein S18 acetylase RimI-like enzyme